MLLIQQNAIIYSRLFYCVYMVDVVQGKNPKSKLITLVIHPQTTSITLTITV